MVAGSWCQNASMAAVIPLPTKGPEDYKRVLDNLMSCVWRLVKYLCERVHTDEEKRTGRMVKLQMFGGVQTDPRPNTTVCPLVCCVNSLAFWKIASFHIHHCLHDWRTGSNDGNPTKLVKVNDFIKRVKKMEARKQGAESQTCQINA
jgi:hypothetical protein